MYKLLLALILIFPLLSKAQITNNIDEVDKLNIYGNGNVKIGKIIIQSTRTRIFYAGYKQTIDSLGIYTTHYLFAPLEKLPTFGIDITIKFDKPLLPFGMDYFMVGPWGGGQSGGTQNSSPDHKEISAVMQVTGPSGVCEFVVKSKEPLFATISGVDGKFKPLIQ